MSEKCCIWIRVSTADQSASNQLPELTAIAEQRGWEIVRTYEVKDSAWKQGTRESGYDIARAQMLLDAHQGVFRYALCWSLDRLTRRGIEDAFALTRQLDNSGVTLVSSQDPWLSTADPFAREIMMSIFASVAKYESARRSERTRAGNARRAAEGLPLGRQRGAKDRKPRSPEGSRREWATKSPEARELHRQRTAAGVRAWLAVRKAEPDFSKGVAHGEPGHLGTG